MSERDGRQRQMKFTEVRQRLSAIVNEVHNEGHRVVIEKNGVPVAAVVTVEDLKRLQELEQRRIRDLAIISEISSAFADVPTEELERQVALAIAEVRAQRGLRVAS